MQPLRPPPAEKNAYCSLFLNAPRIIVYIFLFYFDNETIFSTLLLFCTYDFGLGIPLPNKKTADKNFKRGQMQAIYTQDSMVVLWKDNKSVYMASNVVDMEPLKECRRYSKQDKGYIPIPQPQINFAYNQSMGGVDLVDNSEKNYAITSRVKKWYWALYTWFLNIAMVQAWRLYRAHMAKQHRKAIMEEKMQDEEFEKEMAEGDYTKVTIDRRRKEREKQSKQRRAGELRRKRLRRSHFWSSPGRWWR